MEDIGEVDDGGRVDDRKYTGIEPEVSTPEPVRGVGRLHESVLQTKTSLIVMSQAHGLKLQVSLADQRHH
jgi:hypothetical protein